MMPKKHTLPSSLRRGRHSAFLLVVFCLSVVLCSCAQQRLQTGSRGEDGVPVEFTYVDAEARQVCLTGNFNNWSPQDLCMPRSGDTWSLKISLPPGRYQYLFVIDGRTMRVDPRAVLADDDGFGSRNSVLIVE